jgi:hypothetical protein
MADVGAKADVIEHRRADFDEDMSSAEALHHCQKRLSTPGADPYVLGPTTLNTAPADKLRQPRKRVTACFPSCSSRGAIRTGDR